ncbi:hypothetical protein F4810DRAFT_717725 [Camillea tinctor]|nr:hypothetical protein F4810DRAFT_717725 [Camillea tinctor]
MAMSRASAASIHVRSTDCVPSAPDGPPFITLDCIDPDYNDVIVDTETEESSPFPHHKVSAHFNKSGIALRVYLPPKDRWDGRFFQFVYPSLTADASDEDLSFAVDSGAYWVQSEGQTGYGSDAAAAKFSRTVASKYYGLPSEDIYGYIWGGSGGSYKTVGAIENTIGVWNGAVPYVQAVPVSIPLSFCIRALAGLVLKPKSAGIIDAVRPGGSGDPYTGLNELEASILKEATLMGIPFHSWKDFYYVGGSTTLTLLMDNWKTLDPTYRDAFWTLPGYAGTEASALGDFLRGYLINSTLSVKSLSQAANGSQVIAFETFPEFNDIRGLDYTLYCGNAPTRIGELSGGLNVTEQLLHLDDTNDSTIIDAINNTCKVTIDNTWLIALTTYHHHQVPSRSGFYGFDQFRDENGNPIYIQRSPEVAPSIAKSASGGGTNTGNIMAKVIVVDTLMDSDAFPWHADWYKSQVRSALGDAFGDNYRLWYNENADHNTLEDENKGAIGVDYWGMLQQALRDLAQWVEKDTLPPNSTTYSVEESQIKVSANAEDRYGIQATVSLLSNNSDKVEAAAGTLVTFEVYAEVPPGTGEVVSIEWDPLGLGDYANMSCSGCGSTAFTRVQHQYDTPGTYFPVVRVTSQREGNHTTPFARVSNLGRARIVVQ